MCYYERFDFSCGDHKWGNMKQQCELEYRKGVTCRMAPRALDGSIYRLQDKCSYCKAMQPKLRRMEKLESDIKRWQEDPGRYPATIETKQKELASLRQEYWKLNNKRASVSRRL
jgi:hypothetical protein